MTELAFLFALAPLALAIYCWFLYPLIVSHVGSVDRSPEPEVIDSELPKGDISHRVA